MQDCFSEIGKPFRCAPSWDAERREYPELKAKIRNLLGIIKNAGGDVEKASQAEQRIIEEMREMAMRVCTAGRGTSSKKSRRSSTPSPGLIARKKSSTGSPAWEKSRSRRRSSAKGGGGRRFASFPNRRKFGSSQRLPRRSRRSRGG
jgi:hypothetical protein